MEAPWRVPLRRWCRGMRQFDPALRVAGVLFNRVSSEGHYKLLKEAVEQETDVMVVGICGQIRRSTISDRHLGLVTAMEQGTGELYDLLANAAAETIDLDRIEALARSCRELTVAAPQPVLRNQGSYGSNRCGAGSGILLLLSRQSRVA